MAFVSPYLRNQDDALTDLHDDSFTIAGWFKPNVEPAATEFAPLTIILAPAWSLKLNSDGTLSFAIYDSVSGTTTTLTTTEVCVGDWNFFALRYGVDEETFSIYLNGITASDTFTYAADSSVDSLSDYFQLGDTDLYSVGSISASFDLDEVAVWSRVLTDAEVASLRTDVGALGFPFTGGVINRIFQGRLINDPTKPIILGASRALWAVTPFFDDEEDEFQAVLDLLYEGNETTQEFPWVMTNFYDKIICAQHDNRVQYWKPPLPDIAHDLPGLPVDDAKWDGAVAFAGHLLLWNEDRLKWSDKDDFSHFIPVAETAVSAVLRLTEPFVQPPPGGSLTVLVENPVGEVRSISLTGDDDYGSVQVGETSEGLVNIVNTGTSPVTVTGVSMPEGFSGEYSGEIPVGGAAGIVVTFAPTEAKAYSGQIHVSSDATTGTFDFAIAGSGTGNTKIISLAGDLTFGNVKAGKTVSSAFIIENRGNTTLTVSGITYPTGFTGSYSGTIAAGARQIVSVTFAPTAKASYSGTVTVASDATDGTATLPISGAGVTQFNRAAVFITDNATCNFGKVEVGGTPGTGSLRIYNLTSFDFKVVGLTLPTGFSASYSGNIPTHSYVDVEVTFTPTVNGAYGGVVYASFNKTVDGINSVSVSGFGEESGKVIALSGNLDFGDTPVNGTVQALLKITNQGDEDLTVTSITYPTGFSGAFSGVVAPGETRSVIVSFSPTTEADYSGNLEVTADEDSGTNTYAVSGTGFALPEPLALVADQVVFMEDPRGDLTYYNFYTVVSMNDTNLVLKLMDLTGATPTGLSMPADGRQFFTIDANEAGETRIVGADMNGPVYRVVLQGDYCYSFKERSIQSIQYTGLGSGTFFIHNEISGEGLISREAICDRGDSMLVFLGHKELYTYQGGPNLTPVCQQATRQLYRELDRSRVEALRVFHNENRKEIWVSYPVAGGFRVLIWNYIEDSATFDDYEPGYEFTSLGLLEWSASLVWKQFADEQVWETLNSAMTWESLDAGIVDRIPVLGSVDGWLRVHGLRYSRDGQGYKCLSESMDFDLGEPDIWKYVDTVVVGLEIKVPDLQPRYMYVQIGAQSALSGADIRWTPAKQVLVNGQARIPVKVNPGGSGRYLRVRFSSEDADVQWRVSSFEIHCRAGGLY